MRLRWGRRESAVSESRPRREGEREDDEPEKSAHSTDANTQPVTIPLPRSASEKGRYTHAEVCQALDVVERRLRGGREAFSEVEEEDAPDYAFAEHGGGEAEGALTVARRERVEVGCRATKGMKTAGIGGKWGKQRRM